MRAMGLEAAAAANFDDVAADAYYAGEVAVAKALGLPGGRATTFSSRSSRSPDKR
ncbi:hypothetical protein [Paenibacillus sabuli]|uniref:hypothetical protein n=1 Tax=Paenibacillus sabuli TaxID=2772509 RepID=UPI001CC29811|nr:hypothetical protein [Paenibacillus sabuli]